MSNPGGLHLGCEVCRRRRIKVRDYYFFFKLESSSIFTAKEQCDRSQPECQRCIKYGSPCPGYPREQDIRFRNETAKTVRKR
jgi:hypothetical protein